MRFPAFVALVLLHFPLVFLLATSTSISENFLECLSHTSNNSIPITDVLYTPNDSSYSSILKSSIQNRRFLSSTSTPKPQYIITPLNESHIQAAVICSKKHGLQIRVRSGGHDYEGLSYTSDTQFVIIDLFNLRQVSIDVKDETAWVQAGATVGEVYYRIAEKSSTLGFPAGTCPTVGVGGHFSGGGIGTLMRKYGTSADNIEDAYLIDVNGTLLNRESMGEDLFWAIRGGGGASFGVIFSWKIKLVQVPSTVTVFTVSKTLGQGATDVLAKWQLVADKLDRRLFIRAFIQTVNGTAANNKTIQVSFQSLFLGTISELLPLMKTSFFQLGVAAKDCTETSWIKSAMYNNNFPANSPTAVLLNKSLPSKKFFKAKSDFVREPIKDFHLKKIWKLLLQEDQTPIMIWEPLGGRMSEISESATPFPHRLGNLYNIQYFMPWQEEGYNAATKHVRSVQRLYNYMSPYVSCSPRAAYVNYKDLDLGQNEGLSTSYSKARIWGEMYFKNNFARLAMVKRKIDPGNFLRNKQSIPPLLV
ncbi:hypothetical protein GIB67_011089 [Kingdonia uniflora]|uniref:FAD-binding PCMH-type domain-containing protein n=1 Tax=Kingdonia uniflora TaxID=39325 RepID=A0A7J7LKR7_9MAGN|nr:hypothetical protein GIB67_011089 [Kingdonia uniflora]